MSRRVRLVLAAGLLATLSLGSVTGADAGGRKVFDSTFAGLPVPRTVLNGLTGGGAPWVIEDGKAMVFADGRIHVEVEGLIIPTQGRNPVATGKAVVTCGGVKVAETGLVPFSEEGDAEIDARVTLPSPCQGLTVFFTNATDAWFAVTGF